MSLTAFFILMESDLHLLSRYHRHGDAEAFQSLVEAHAGMVHATACRVTRDAALAQDVAQETFLALARSSGKVIHSVGAWLHQVAWQKALNAMRGESRRQSYETAAAAEMCRHSEEAAWSELEPWLDEALGELPEHIRAILVERFLEGRTQQELAVRFGINQSTVSRQLDAALNQLRSRLRAKGVLCGAGFALLLERHSAGAAPEGVAASLGKVSISGLGTKAVISPGASTLIAMTTTTKILISAAAVAIVSVPFIQVTQRSQDPLPKNPPAKVKPQPSGTAATAASTTNAGDGRRHYRPSPVANKLRLDVEDFIRRHKDLAYEELMASAEFKILGERFSAVLDTPEMEAKMKERVEAIKASSNHEHGTLSLEIKSFDDARGRAWLEAVISNDAKRMEDWVLNALDNAVFEFAFAPDLERTSKGVLLNPATSAPIGVPADPAKND